VNVLKFSIEYIRTFKKKEEVVDLKVDDIDKAEVMDAPQRLEAITDYIIANHSRKTHNKKFTAIFCVSSVDSLINYYKLFRQKREMGEHNLRIGTIFSYQANEEDEEAMGLMEEPLAAVAEPEEEYVNKHSRDHLEDFIRDYNEEF